MSARGFEAAWLKVKVGARLRSARDVRGLTQAEVAEITGLKPSAVSHFEAGRRAPSLANLVRLSRALHVSADKLLGLDS